MNNKEITDFRSSYEVDFKAHFQLNKQINVHASLNGLKYQILPLDIAVETNNEYLQGHESRKKGVSLIYITFNETNNFVNHIQSQSYH